MPYSAEDFAFSPLASPYEVVCTGSVIALAPSSNGVHCSCVCDDCDVCDVCGKENLGDASLGDASLGETAEGDTAEGDTAEGDTAEGDKAEGETTSSAPQTGSGDEAGTTSPVSSEGKGDLKMSRFMERRSRYCTEERIDCVSSAELRRIT